MVITYQLPATATLAWVPIAEANDKLSGPAYGMGQCKDGTWIVWWGKEPPFGDYQSLTERLYPDGGGIKAPQPGDVIECPCGSFRVVRTVRACKACYVGWDEWRRWQCPSAHDQEKARATFVGHAFQQEYMRIWVEERMGPDAWQHWGWLVEVKAESEGVMVITYQLPDTATLAWVPCPDIPANYRRMASDCDKSGAWWFSDMPRKEGPFRMSEFAKWTHIYPKQPQPGDVIECPCGSFRVVRTLRACKAYDVTPEEGRLIGCTSIVPEWWIVWQGTIGESAWQHWGWLVEVTPAVERGEVRWNLSGG